MGGTGGLGYLCCGLVCPRGCTLLPLSAAPVGVSHTATLVSTIGLGFPLPCWPMLSLDNFVSGLVSFISHLGALPGSWTVTTLLSLSRLLSLQGSGCSRRSPFFTWACRPSHHTLTLARCSSLAQTSDKSKPSEQDFLLEDFSHLACNHFLTSSYFVRVLSLDVPVCPRGMHPVQLLPLDHLVHWSKEWYKSYGYLRDKESGSWISFASNHICENLCILNFSMCVQVKIYITGKIL